MKNAFVGIVILGLVFFALLAIFDLEISITPKKPSPQKIAGHLPENKPEQPIEPVGSAQDIVASSAAPAATAIAEPPKDAGIPQIVPSEQRDTQAKDPGPSPNDKPTQNLGLLTDTGETEDNGIFEPHSTQVQPIHPKNAVKKAERPPVETIIQEAAILQIAILPEGNYPFSILLETFDKQANAQQAVALYRKRGFSAFWVKADLGHTGVKYRLFTGIFATEAAAQTFRSQHHLNAQHVKNTLYSCRIGTFQDKNDLSHTFTKTTETGVFPYVLGKEGGPFFLYVGAFYNADGAENQCRELVNKGLPCKAALRSTLPPKN